MKILVVEDETFVALLIEDMLQSLGHDVYESVASLAEGLETARTGNFDAAILDVNLGLNTTSLPIADVLVERGIPFAFSTGYSANALDARFSCAPKLQKPFQRAMLEKVVEGFQT